MGREASKDATGAVAREAHRHWHVGKCELEETRRRARGRNGIRGGMMLCLRLLINRTSSAGDAESSRDTSERDCGEDQARDFFSSFNLTFRLILGPMFKQRVWSSHIFAIRFHSLPLPLQDTVSGLARKYHSLTMSGDTTTPPVSISPLLLQLADPTTTLYSISASEIAAAVALIFSNSISPVQTGCLLYALHSTQLDRRPDILAACAQAMRDAASQTDVKKLREVVKSKNMAKGRYEGGLVSDLFQFTPFLAKCNTCSRTISSLSHSPPSYICPTHPPPLSNCHQS